MMKKLAVSLALAGCPGAVKVEPVQIQPIHITVDVNLRDKDGPVPVKQP